MKIGILGGTFNPLHKGHLHIARKIYEKGIVDQVWMVPTYRTPNKAFFPEKISSKHRMKMIDVEIKHKKYNKWLKLNDYEIKQKRTSYTIYTIEYFISKYPEHEFYLIMGDDVFKTFKNWKNYEKILEKTKLIVYKRNGLSEKEQKKYPIIYINDIVYNISSTDILSKLLWEKIPNNTRKYIAKKKLYLKSIIFYKLYETKRFEHSLSVASYAKRLSQKKENIMITFSDNSEFYFKKIFKKGNLNKQERAYYAGLMHDMFKYDSEASLIKIISENSNWALPHKDVMHGYAAAIWLQSFYWIKDEKLTNAIKKHTMPDDNMKSLDKIVYVADKISGDRKGDEILHLRKMAFLDLNETFKKLLKKQYDQLVELKLKIPETFENSYKKYVLEEKIKNKKGKWNKNVFFKRLN
ncbi:MAG: nicotinate-nucleotide adenylyltransferase [Candidatus Hepatoplasma vulgare]|nr:MAG: nicotinate-nucleotide adenylyltransferase [Candidatus Hepatoplasma sp.]